MRFHVGVDAANQSGGSRSSRARLWPAGLEGVDGGHGRMAATCLGCPPPKLESCPPLACPRTPGAPHAPARESAGPCWLRGTPAAGGVAALRLG